MNKAQETEHVFRLYVAVTDCLPVSQKSDGRALRPVKIGRTKCLCDRLKALNGGSFTPSACGRISEMKTNAETKRFKRSLPLGGCTRWRMIASSSDKFSDNESRELEHKMEEVFRNAGGRWSTRCFEDNLALVARNLGKRGSTNGIGEIYSIDSSQSGLDGLIVSLSDSPVLQDLLRSASANLNDEQACLSKIACSERCGSNALWIISNREIGCAHLIECS